MASSPARRAAGDPSEASTSAVIMQAAEYFAQLNRGAQLSWMLNRQKRSQTPAASQEGSRWGRGVRRGSLPQTTPTIPAQPPAQRPTQSSRGVAASGAEEGATLRDPPARGGFQGGGLGRPEGVPEEESAEGRVRPRVPRPGGVWSGVSEASVPRRSSQGGLPTSLEEALEAALRMDLFETQNLPPGGLEEAEGSEVR